MSFPGRRDTLRPLVNCQQLCSQHTHIYPHTPSHTHTHLHAHLHTHTHTHSHTHTHTHTHTHLFQPDNRVSLFLEGDDVFCQILQCRHTHTHTHTHTHAHTITHRWLDFSNRHPPIRRHTCGLEQVFLDKFKRWNI